MTRSTSEMYQSNKRENGVVSESRLHQWSAIDSSIPFLSSSTVTSKYIKKKQYDHNARVCASLENDCTAVNCSCSDEELGDIVKEEVAPTRRRKKSKLSIYRASTDASSSLLQGGTGSFDVLDEALAVAILLYLEPDARLSQCCSTCRGFFALRNKAAMWPVLVCRSAASCTSCKQNTSNGFSETALVRLASKLPLGNLERLELDADGNSKKNISFRRGWKPLLTAIPCDAPNLQLISLRGTVFKTAALKLIGIRFGRQLKHLEFRNNDARKLLIELLSRTTNLETLGLDHFSEAGAIANAHALNIANATHQQASSISPSNTVHKNKLRRIVVFKRSVYSDIEMERAVSLGFFVTRLGELYPNLQVLDIKQVVLPTGLVDNLSEMMLLPPTQSDDPHYEQTTDIHTQERVRSRIIDRLLATSGTTSKVVKPLIHLRTLSLSLRLLGVAPSSSSSVVAAVIEVLIEACPALSELALDLEATAALDVICPLLNGLQSAAVRHNNFKLKKLAVLGLHVLDSGTDARSIFDAISSLSWLQSLECLRLIFSDLPFYGSKCVDGNVSNGWTAYFRTVFGRVEAEIKRLADKPDVKCQLDAQCCVNIGIADRRKIPEPQLHHDRAGTATLDGILWLQNLPRIHILEHNDADAKASLAANSNYNENLLII